MDLSNFTVEQLTKELERRSKEEEKWKNVSTKLELLLPYLEMDRKYTVTITDEVVGTSKSFPLYRESSKAMEICDRCNNMMEIGEPDKKGLAFAKCVSGCKVGYYITIPK